jgi:hypothetical protein
MSKDFIPVRELTPAGLNSRYLEWSALDKRIAGQGTPTEQLNIEDFKKRLHAFRQLVCALAEPRINKHFAAQFLARFPDFGKPIASVDDFSHYCAVTPNSKELREQAAFAFHGLWGKGNRWAIPMEQQIMDLLQIKYKPHLTNGKTKRKIHQTACIGGCIVRKRGMMVLDKGRSVSKRSKREAFCVKDHNVGDLKLNGEKKKKPATLPKGIVKIVEARVGTHGFDGFLGLCSGHELLETDVPATPVKKPEVEDSEESPLVAFAKKQAALGITSLADFSKAALEESISNMPTLPVPTAIVTPPNVPQKETANVPVSVTPPNVPQKETVPHTVSGRLLFASR